MNNKYEDLKSIRKTAKIYWILFAIATVAGIALFLTPLGKEAVSYFVSNINNTTLSEAEINAQLEQMVNKYSGQNTIVLMLAALISIIGLAIFIYTIIAVVKVFSFNKKYQDQNYKAMMYSAFLVIIAMVPIFFIVLSVKTSEKNIISEK